MSVQEIENSSTLLHTHTHTHTHKWAGRARAIRKPLLVLLT